MAAKRQEREDPISFASIFSAQKPIDVRLRRLDNAIACEMEKIADLREKSTEFRAMLVAEIEPYEWDIHGQIDAEKIARNLKSRPSETVLRLTATRFGLEWLLDRWDRLLYVQRINKTWSDAQIRLALDLLGTPEEFRDSPNAVEIGKGEALVQGRIELAQREIARLNTIKANYAIPRDARRFDQAKSGAILLPDDSHKRLLAEIKDCEKSLKWATCERDRLLKILSLQPRPNPVPDEPPAEPAATKPSSECKAETCNDASENGPVGEPTFAYSGSRLQAGTADSKDIYSR